MSQKIKTILTQILPAIILATFFTVFIVYAWTEPSTSPPGGNVAAPINVSGNAQIKAGPLQVNGFRNIGNTILDGNVGIGTAAPGSMLNIKGANTAPSNAVLTIQSGNTAVVADEVLGKLEFGSSDPSQFGTGIGADIRAIANTAFTGGGRPTDLAFYTQVIGNPDTYPLAERMRITSTGNVGIGTAAPGTKLEVAGQIKITGGTPGAGKVLTSDAAGLASWQAITGTLPSGTSGQTLRHDGTNWMANSVLSNDGTRVIINGTVDNLLTLSRSGATYSTVFKVGADSALIVNSGGSDVMTLKGGNVGIGTAAPGYKLEVNGTFRASGNWSLGGSALTNLAMNNYNITGVNKLTVTTIDPLYEINGKKYATYVSSIAGGVKEEYVGKGRLIMTNDYSYDGSSSLYSYAIDFSKVENGSDLWLWYRAVDFSRDNVEVFATPYGVALPIAYEIDGEKIVFRAQLPIINYQLQPNDIEFSYRLVGKRFDWRNWPTLAKDQNENTTFNIK